MKRENISDIRRSLEPSAEMKRRVMERAKKLEAGKKTFGNEKTTTDNIHINKTKENKEIITMSMNRSEMNTVKSHLPAAVVSVAACAALVIGIAAAGLRSGDREFITDSGAAAAPGTQPAPVSTTASVTEAVAEDDPVPEDVMTVTGKDGETYTITDKDRIAAIDALIEKVKKCHVWEGEEVPATRTIRYTLDGKERTVEISNEQLSPYHPDSKPHPEFCMVVTVEGKAYAVCEYTPDEPYADLYCAIEKGGVISFQKWAEKAADEDENVDNSIFEEYHNEADARRLKGIIDKVRENGTLQFEAEDQYIRDEEHLPSWDDVRATFRFILDGNLYDVELFRDSDLICIDVLEWHDGRNLTLLYKDTGNWTAEFDEAFDSLTDNPEEYDHPQEEDEEVSDLQYSEPPAGKVKLPELFDLTEEQAVAALKEAGLNCLIEYRFSDTEKGYVSSYYGGSDYYSKGDCITVEISLGEYDGPNEMLGLEHGTGYYPSKESTLEVPVPDGLSGSYTFNIYLVHDVECTNTADEIKGMKSVALKVDAIDKMRYVVYAKNNSSAEENLIRYATYEFDYEAETWTLIGELNTAGLLGTMN